MDASIQRKFGGDESIKKHRPVLYFEDILKEMIEEEEHNINFCLRFEYRKPESLTKSDKQVTLKFLTKALEYRDRNTRIKILKRHLTDLLTEKSAETAKQKKDAEDAANRLRKAAKKNVDTQKTQLTSNDASTPEGLQKIIAAAEQMFRSQKTSEEKLTLSEAQTNSIFDALQTAVKQADLTSSIVSVANKIQSSTDLQAKLQNVASQVIEEAKKGASSKKNKPAKKFVQKPRKRALSKGLPQESIEEETTSGEAPALLVSEAHVGKGSLKDNELTQKLKQLQKDDPLTPVNVSGETSRDIPPKSSIKPRTGQVARDVRVQQARTPTGLPPPFELDLPQTSPRRPKLTPQGNNPNESGIVLPQTSPGRPTLDPQVDRTELYDPKLRRTTFSAFSDN